MRKSRWILWALIAVFFAACETVGVEICDAPQHPHLSQLIINYTWPEQMVQRGLVPEKSWVIANRPADPLRYLFGWFTASDRRGMELAYLNNDPSEEKQPYLSLDSMLWFAGEALLDDMPDSCGIRVGQYQMVTTNCSNFLLIDSLTEFMQSHEIFPSHLSIKYNTEVIADSIDPALHDWVDYNPEYPFVKDIGPVFFDQQIVTSPRNASTVVDFTPELISQQLDLQFKVQSEDQNLVLDSIKGELSGVVRSKSIFTGYLDMDATHSCRIMFDAKIPSSPSGQGSTRVWNCETTIDVLGLCNPVSEKMQTGPGIVHLAAYVHYIEPAKPAEGIPEKLVKRTIFWGVNLHQVFKSHPVTKQTQDKRHHVCTSNHEVLVIPNLLQMSLKDFEGEDGIETWPDDPDAGNGDFDIEF